MFIYGLFSPDGELRYVGKTVKKLEQRLSSHLKNLKPNNYKNHWLKSLKKQGLRPYIQAIQEFYNEVDLNNAEIYWIKYFREVGCRLTNSTDGGDGCSNPTPEVRAKISAGNKGKPSYWKGRKRSLENLEKLRKANVGKTLTPEHCARMSAALKGKKLTLDRRIQMSLLRGARPIIDHNGVVYASIGIASEILGIAKPSISAVIKGKHKQAKGYTFAYAENGIPQSVRQLIIVDNYGNKYKSAREVNRKLGIDSHIVNAILKGWRINIRDYTFKYVEVEHGG